jgi:GNAT superfamily N-acetyltransferase
MTITTSSTSTTSGRDATTDGGVTIRPGDRRDYPAVRELLYDAYGPYAADLSPNLYHRYLHDLLDLRTHEQHGALYVAEADGRIAGSAWFYPDASVQGMGWPTGWAGGRALGVHPRSRARGIATALLSSCEASGREVGAPVFAFHTATFMTTAVALYERLGYVRLPEFDVDLARRFGSREDYRDVTAIAFARCLGEMGLR